MAFGDWESYKFNNSGSPMTSTLETATPILGGGSLFHQGQDSAECSINTQLRSNFNRGLTKGRIRTLISPNFSFTSGYAELSMGIYFMCSDVDPSNNPSNFYFAGITDPVTTLWSPVVGKALGKQLWELDLEGVAADRLGPALSQFSFTGGDVVPIQVEWDSNLATYGGTRIIFQMGLVGDENFDNLTTIYDTVDGASPLTTSVVEGLSTSYGSASPVITTARGILFDSTGVFQLV